MGDRVDAQKGELQAGPQRPLERRGLHVMVRGEASVPTLEKLLAEVAPALHLNWVILELNGNFAFALHPECAGPGAMTKASARRLAALARQHHVELVPMYNCLGHQSWKAKAGVLLRAHPEFNEAPDLDASAEDFYCMSWCPNHPDLPALVSDLFDELLEAFEAKAFHVGMDEVFVLGECPRCKGTPNADLFAKAVHDLHAHLVGQRQVEMQMWGDRLLDASRLGYGTYEASANDTWPAIDMIPKDIVICDWRYTLALPDFPTLRFFQDKGFRVWPASWNDEAAVRRLIEVAREEEGPRMLGYLATTWWEINPLVEGLAADLTGVEKPADAPAAQEQRIAQTVATIELGAKLAYGGE